MPQAIIGINEAALYPVYQSRQHYRVTVGQEPPPYNPARAPKNWFDSTAISSPRRNVVYDSVVAQGDSGQPLRGPDGKPQLEILVLRKEEAATVNLFETGLGEPAPSEPPVPVPLRALQPHEELEFGFGGTVVIRDKTIPLPSEQTGFTPADRKLLQQIGNKIGLNP
jgi:hypothetical protein